MTSATHCLVPSTWNAAWVQSRLGPLSNDISCSVFGLVVFVTLSYYYLLLQGQIEDSDKVN